MKRMISLLVLFTSITATVCAQKNTTLSNTDKTFEPPANSITRRFITDLGKGNKMLVEMSNINNIEYLKNIDSLVKVFMHDIEPLKDSLGNELTAKRIDYVTDSMGRKKIRIQQYQPKGSSFLVEQNDVAALKVEQDTIYISGTVPGKSTSVLTKKETVSNYYRIGFFINQLAELNTYLDGRLNEKLNNMVENKRWVTQPDGNWHIRNGDPSIYAKAPGGHVGGAGDYLQLKAGIDVQNYKNYFVPSFTLSATAFLVSNNHRYQLGVAWEPHFLFAKNTQGNLVTYRNDFITLLVGRQAIKSKIVNTSEPSFTFFQHLSIGYLVRQKGDIYDPHTFRIGTGAVEWKGGKIKLEPVFYFNNFFKNVTPGLRLGLGF